MIAPLAPDEAERLETLRAYAVLDTPPESEYDDLTRLAAFICGTPIALVSIIDPCRQWFKSHFGIDATETPRDVAFCAHAILGDDLFVVPDSHEDKRFKDNSLVTGPPHVRFYAGTPLTTPEGYNLGTLCVIDHVPRRLTEQQRHALKVLGHQVVAQLLLRRQVEALKALAVEREKAAADLRASEERFRAFMDHSPAVAFMKDEAGRYAYVNEPACRFFCIPAEQWIGRTDLDLFPEDLARTLQETDRRVMASGETHVVYETAPTPDGEAFYWQSFKFPFAAADGARYLAGMSVDRTPERKAEEALRQSETMFRNTVDRLAEGVCAVDVATKTFVDANAALLAMLGYTAAEFIALSPFDLVAGETAEVFARNVKYVDERLAREGRCDVGRRWFRRKDGSVLPVDLRATVVPNGGAGLHAVIVRDVTEQVEHENRLFEYQSQLEDANARLKALASTDGLTGVKNRAAFNERLAEEFDRATRYGRPLSMILLDVDHFKLFNDVYGHPAGDDVLKAVGVALRQAARFSDVVARYGGEEFAIILPDTDASRAMVVAERIRRAVAEAPWEKRAVTVSVGVATWTSTTEDAGDLVREADEALYRSKQAGRNRVSSGSRPIPNPVTSR